MSEVPAGLEQHMTAVLKRSLPLCDGPEMLTDVVMRTIYMAGYVIVEKPKPRPALRVVRTGDQNDAA